MANETKIFKICKLLLVFAGITVEERPDWSEFARKFYKVFALGSRSLYATCLPLFAIEILVNGQNVGAVLAALKSSTFVGVVIGKLFILQSKKVRNIFKELIDEENVTVSMNDPMIQLIYKEQVFAWKKVTAALMLGMFSTVNTFIGDAIYRSVDFYKTHPNATITTEKPFPIALWLPYKNKYYKTALLFQIIHILQTLYYNGSIQPLVISVIIFLKAKLKILQHRLRNLEPFANQTTRPENVLKQFIKEHQELIRLHGEFNASFQYIVLMEYCAASLTLAFTFIELLQRQRILFHLLFSGYVSTQLFTLAWNANEILLESSFGLAYALYESPWYRMDKTSKKLIQIMMMRCRKPLTILIGPFGFMDLNAAVSRMKMAYSVVSVFSTNQ